LFCLMAAGHTILMAILQLGHGKMNLEKLSQITLRSGLSYLEEYTFSIWQ